MTGWIERLASTTTLLSLTVSIFSINISSLATSCGFAALPMLRFEFMLDVQTDFWNSADEKGTVSVMQQHEV